MYDVVYGPAQGFLFSLDMLRQALMMLSFDEEVWSIKKIDKDSRDPRVFIRVHNKNTMVRCNDLLFSLPVLEGRPRSGLEQDILVNLHQSTLRLECPGLYLLVDGLVRNRRYDFFQFWYPLTNVLKDFDFTTEELIKSVGVTVLGGEGKMTGDPL